MTKNISDPVLLLLHSQHS